tara:strand:+ start:726 stop:1232 length:507 start_codon:yes stop_codon:yes gene_type:complete
MTEKFNKAVKLILKHEGGYVDHPDDPGGETNFGISKRAFPDVDIKNLTEEKAAEIYKEKYWRKIFGPSLPPALAIHVFDYAVNSGVKRASKTLQRLVKTKPDGVIGLITVEAVGKHYKKDQVKEQMIFIEQYRASRMDFLVGLKTFKTFGKGWTRRVNETHMEAMRNI